MCWPCEEKIHFCAEGIFRSLKVSEVSVLLNKPFLLIQGPKLVETETSGEVVIILLPNSVSFFAYWSKILPKAFWVEILVSVIKIISSTGIFFELYLRNYYKIHIFNQS